MYPYVSKCIQVKSFRVARGGLLQIKTVTLRACLRRRRPVERNEKFFFQRRGKGPSPAKHLSYQYHYFEKFWLVAGI